MKTSISFGLIFFLGIALSAQPGNKGFDNSSRQVTTKFEPKLMSASKLLLDPIVPRTENPRINVKFETPEFDWNTRKITRPITPEKLKEQGSDSVYLSNYARIGGGNYAHTLGEIYLSNRKNSNYSYNFSGLHLGADPANSLRQFSTNKFLLQAAKYYENAGLETHVFYNRDKINYFGRDTNLRDMPVLNTGKISQNYGFGIDYNYIASGKLPNIKAGIGAQGFDNNLSQKEMELNAYVLAIKKIKNTELGLDVSATYIDMQQRPDTLKYKGVSENKQLFIDAFPFMKFTHNPTQLNIKLGAKITHVSAIVDSKSPDSKFYINPLLEIEKNLTGLNLKLYGGIDGGLKKNSFRRLNSMMPFAFDSLSVKNTYESINGFTGIKGKINQNAEFSLDFGGNSSSEFALVVSNNDSLRSLKFKYVNLSSLYFRSVIKYKVGEQLRVLLHAKAVNYNVVRNSYAWHLPGFIWGMSANYTLAKNIELQLGMDGMGKRRNQIGSSISNNYITKEMKGFVDMHARIDYRVASKGRIWLQGSNLLNSQYQQWYGYQNYGLTIMGGLSLSLF